MKHLFTALLLATAAPLAAQTVATADTPGKVAGGATFTQPKDFAVETEGPVTTITTPEANASVSLIDVGAARDAADAVGKAWALGQPGFARTLKVSTPIPAQEGWDERVAFDYVTSPDEKKYVAAIAMRKGDRWTVAALDAALATLDKRGAALFLLQSSIRPGGYVLESFEGKTAHRLTPERIKLMTDFVAEGLRAIGVPGAGLALIDQGKVVYQGGVGVKALGKSDAVTADTKFMIASNTKGMATLLLATLVDEGKLGWDQPVTQVYPSFRLGDDATTRATLVRHLVCACTGLPRKDLGWILQDAKVPATDTFVQLAATQPTSKFGELFQYNNLMASAAGYVGGALAYPGQELGAAFDRAMQTRIFDPLGMTSTTFDFDRAMTGDWAKPHGLALNGRMVELDMLFNTSIVPHRPAGGAWSSARDMARYAQLELSKGLTPDGKRLVSEAALLERRKPGVQDGENAWYGMGLGYGVKWGVPVVDHGGSMLGYKSNFWVLPEAGIGAVLLTNADEGRAMLAPFLRRLLEVVYDGKPEALDDVRSAGLEYQAQMKAVRDKLDMAGDAATLAALAPRYRNAELGEAVFTRKGGTMWVKAGVVDSAIGTRKNPDGSVSLVTTTAGISDFELLPKGEPGARTLVIRDSQHEYVYAEVK